MTYKRQTDRLPIIPADAKEHNVTCHYCIVGCGYKAYTWPMNKQGGFDAKSNKFGVDLSKQQGAETAAWYAPSMYNVVKQNGQDVQLVIKPDADCVVNSGLGSIRGARMAENHTSQQRGTQLQRLTDPMVWRYGSMQPTNWDDALDLVARVTSAVITEQGEDGLFVSMFDHGGSAGGYENTWGTGKLYFGAMKVKNVRIHNRPAYNSEVHATRDMGVGELNNCYEDAELADTIVAIGTNPLETQTNYFLNHWVPNLRGTSLDKKKKEFPGEPVEAGRIIIIDPRRTVTVAACEAEAGKDKVLHLALEPGTDLVLFNALLTYIADKGWTDKAFIASSTLPAQQGAALISRPGGAPNDQPLTDFTAALGREQDVHRRCGEDYRAQGRRYRQGSPMDCRAKSRRQTPTHDARLREGNHLGQRQLPHQWRDRKPGACNRQRRASGWRRRSARRPSGGLFASVRCSCRASRCLCRQTPDRRPRRHPPHLGMRSLQDNVERPQAQANLQAPHGHGEGCHEYGAMGRPQGHGRRHHGSDQARRIVLGRRRIVPTQIGQASHVWLPAAVSGEMNLTSMNGERRMRLTERYMDPPGNALPDCLIAARLANNMERVLREQGKGCLRRPIQGLRLENRGGRLQGRLCQHEKGGEHVSYARLKAMGNNGFQEPATAFADQKIAERSVSIPMASSRPRTAKPFSWPRRGADCRRGQGRAEGQVQVPRQQRTDEHGLAKRVHGPIQRLRHGSDALPVHRDESGRHERLEFGCWGSRRNLQRCRFDAGHGTTDTFGKAKPDVHAVCLSDRCTGQRRQCRGERADHSKLQADLGRHPEDCLRIGDDKTAVI